MQQTSDPIAVLHSLLSGTRDEKGESVGERSSDLAEQNSELVNAIVDKIFQISLQSAESSAVLEAQIKLVLQQLTTQLQRCIDDIDFDYLVDYVIQQQPRDDAALKEKETNEALGKLCLHQKERICSVSSTSTSPLIFSGQELMSTLLHSEAVKRQKVQILTSLDKIISALASPLITDVPRKCTLRCQAAVDSEELTRFQGVMSCLVAHASFYYCREKSISEHWFSILERIKILSKASIVSPEVRAAFKSITEKQYERREEEYSGRLASYSYEMITIRSNKERTKADLLKSLPLHTIGKYAVILLLGPPGIGKSRLSKLLVANGLASNFMDVGRRLLARGDIEESQRVPTDAQRQHLHEAAAELLSTSLQSYFATDGELPLIVTFVNVVDDAYTFLDTVKTTAQCHGRQGTVQAWYLRDDDFVSSKDRRAHDRLHKCWMGNNAGILEVFATTGILRELSKREWQPPVYSYNHDDLDDSQLPWKVIRHISAFTPLPLECDLTTRNRITGEMKSLLGVTELLPALPLSFLQNNEQQIRWLSYPGRYWVSHKADGTRYFLYIDNGDNGWLLNRAGSLYRIPPSDETSQSCATGSSSTVRPPAGTIFDGELVTATDGELVYLAFDVLHFQGQRTWQRPFSDRISLLRTWDSGRKRSGAADDAIVASSFSIVLKASYPVSQLGAVASLIAHQQDGRAGFFKVDGLIFTPELPYTFGRDALLFKWQSPDDVKADLDFSAPENNSSGVPAEATTRRGGVSSSTNMLALLDVPSRTILGPEPTTTSYRNPLPPLGFIYECIWSKQHETWLPQSVRFDKTDCNAPKTIASIESMLKTSVNSMLTSANLVDVFNAAKIPMLHMDMSSIQQGLNKVNAAEEMKKPINAARHRHPARSMDFESLLRDVYDLVDGGLVEKYVHADTGLEVFSCLDREKVESSPPAQVAGSSSENGNDHPPAKLSADVCRGLVLHPPSKTVVANAFVRFFKPTHSEIDALSDCIVRASIKYDGSLIIAFVWQGQLHTSTRRRMDSEQAVWATERLRSCPAVLAEFKPHWTYLLELVGGDNTRAIDYTFEETLIFISAFNEEGKEVDLAERLAIAKRADLFAVQPIEGKLCEFLATMHDPAAAAAAAAAAPPRVAKRGGEAVGNKRVSWADALKVPVAHASRLYLSASCEGWVVENPNDGRRFKLINPIWDRASAAMKRLLHPVAVWDEMRMGRIDSLLNNPVLPRCARHEIHAMVDAIATIFDASVIDNALLSHPIADDGEQSETKYKYTSKSESTQKHELLLSVTQVSMQQIDSRTLAASAAHGDVTLLISMLHRADVDGIDIDYGQVLSSLKKEHSRIISLIPLLPSHEISSHVMPWETVDDCYVGPMLFNVLRLLLLNCARPQPSGNLPGYQPSHWLSQTYAKGWKTIPDDVCTDLLSWSSSLGNASSLFDRLMDHAPAAKLIFDMLAPPPPGSNSTPTKGLSELSWHPLTSAFSRCQAVPRLLTVCKSWRNNLTAMFREDLVKWKQECDEARKKRLTYVDYYEAEYYDGMSYGAGYDEEYDDDPY